MDKLDSEQKFQLKKMLKNWDKIEPNIIDGRGTMTPAIGDIYVFQTANGKKHGISQYIFWLPSCFLSPQRLLCW